MPKLKLVSGSKPASSAPAPPDDLGAAGKDLWRRLTDGYAISDEGGRAVLEVAARACDRAEDCRRRVAKDGPTVRDRWRQVKPHPLLAVERAARAQMLQAVKQLALPLPED